MDIYRVGVIADTHVPEALPALPGEIAGLFLVGRISRANIACIPGCRCHHLRAFSSTIRGVVPECFAFQSRGSLSVDAGAGKSRIRSDFPAAELDLSAERAQTAASSSQRRSTDYRRWYN